MIFGEIECHNMTMGGHDVKVNVQLRLDAKPAIGCERGLDTNKGNHCDGCPNENTWWRFGTLLMTSDIWAHDVRNVSAQAHDFLGFPLYLNPSKSILEFLSAPFTLLPQKNPNLISLGDY